MECVRCYRQIAEDEGYALIEGRTLPEVPCCLDCYAKREATRARGAENTRREAAELLAQDRARELRKAR